MEIRKGVIKLLPEDNPADLYPHAQCDVCGGTIKQNWDDKDLWECDSCDWSFKANKKGGE